MTAFVRGIPQSFVQATTEVVPDPPIDVVRAKNQHAAYVQALRSLGMKVIEIATDDRRPDACFVEDCAVVADGVALIARSGAASRRGESEPVERALAAHLPSIANRIHRMESPATLDGGDCLRVGRTLYVGLSGRTNEHGIAVAREVFDSVGLRVVMVPLAAVGVLHLKCVCSALDDDRVLLAEDTVPRGVFADVECVMVPHEEAYAANCVARDGTALIAAGFPRTRAIVERAGLRVVPLETSEIRKADGALTCLSILVSS